jgi:hypothetical protein
MEQQTEAKRFSIRSAWRSATTGARLWGAAAAVVATGAILVVAASFVGAAGDASGRTPSGQAAGSKAVSSPVTSTPAPSATGSPAARSGASSMAGGSMSSGATTSAGKAMSPVSTSSALSVCPDVAGTTTMSDGMVMAPVTTGPPTAAQQAAAAQLVSQTTQALTRYASLAAAQAAGYVPATNPDGYVVHYADWRTVASGDVLDPDHPSSLVYANTVSGPLLLGAMYMGPAPCQPGPDVGGSLTQWHAHANLCLSAAHQVVGRTSSTGVCGSGTHNTDTYFMLHVWTAPALASTHQFAADLPVSAIAPIIRSGQA